MGTRMTEPSEGDRAELEELTEAVKQDLGFDRLVAEALSHVASPKLTPAEVGALVDEDVRRLVAGRLKDRS